VAPFDFRVLGPLELRRDGELLPLPAPKQRALVGFLLLHANEPVSPDQLIEELWGEEPPASARASLRNQIHALRKLLGTETLTRGPGGYVLNVEPGELDLERFERLVADAKRAEPRERVAKLRAALALWRGAALVEFPSEPFAQHEIARLEEKRLIALEDRIDAELELGEHADLVPELESLVHRYPLRERLWGQLMLALYRARRPADAAATYRRAHRTFVDELGIEPGPALRDLQRAILAQDATLDDPGHRLGSTLERAAAILPMRPRDRAESLYEYALALLRTGEQRRAVATLEAAARLAATAGERAVEQRARLYLSYLSIWSDRRSPLAYLAEAERAAVQFEARGDREGLVVALRHQCQMLALSGRAEAAAEKCLVGARLAAELGDRWRQAGFLGERALALAAGPTPVEEALRLCDAVLAEDVWDAPTTAHWNALGLLYAQAGRIEEARETGERAIGEARAKGLVLQLFEANQYRGRAELIDGNVHLAVQHLRTAHELLAAEAQAVDVPTVAALAACLVARRGDISEARELAQAARAETAPDVFEIEVLWRRAFALVSAQEGRFEEALMLSQEAKARADSSDWLTFRGETLEDAALVHRLAGDDRGEADALAEALALYERKGNVPGVRRIAQAREVGR
jgi:DNA-binding SARP family transcriptional activator